MTAALAIILTALSVHPNDGPDVDLRIRVEKGKVVAAIMMNLVFCDEIVDVPRSDKEDLAPDEEEPLRSALFAYFKEHNKVRIDGIEVTPQATRFEVPEPEHSLLPLFPRFGMRALFKVRLTLTYAALSPPERVNLVWGPFPPDYALGFENDAPPMEVAAVLLAQGEEEVIIFLKEEPEYTWHRSDEEPKDRFLHVPVSKGKPDSRVQVPMVSGAVLAVLLLWGVFGAVTGRMRHRQGVYGRAVVIGLVVAAVAWPFFRVAVPLGAADVDVPTRQEALEIFRPLHANIYNAFHFIEESEIYDALARSVDGELLEGLYNEVYASLVMQEEGGAVSRVTAVRMSESDIEHIGIVGDRPGFQVRARWQVDGSVFHWGHSHHRTNEYQARYSVVETGGGWRISGSETLEQKQLEATIPEPVRPRDREVKKK
ncbi:MAG: hypothetical protein HRU14_13860 [Planctomycetes bacterium]|nr:hypothetical protein [Planctomycetota bacterium]